MIKMDEVVKAKVEKFFWIDGVTLNLQQ